MATEIQLQNQSDESMNNILAFIGYAGSSIAAIGGGLAVILTYIGDLAQWVFICGASIGLLGGIVGLVAKVINVRFEMMKFREFQKSIERDNEMYENAKRAGERDKLKKDVLNELKSEVK